MSLRRLLALALALCLLPLAGLALDGPVYEVFVASFADGDGDRVGDLKGLREKLDYIESLHVGGLWLMPIHPSPSYHKYDVTDYQAIDPSYGSLEDFRELARACDQRGISLLMDLVINHSSDQHPWFLAAIRSLKEGSASPYRDYYQFSQSGGHPVPAVPGWYYAGHFGPHMPELNLDSPALREEILSILRFWLSQGADGFRLDAAFHFYEENASRNSDFLAWFTRQVKAIRTDAYVVAEVWKDAGSILSHYGSGLDSLFNFPFADATGLIVDSIRQQRGQRLAERLAAWNAQIKAIDPQAMDAPFLSNHDTGRSAGFLMYKPERMKLAAALYLSMPGIPYVYYGEEIGMSGSGRDENKRLPMLWRANEADNCLPPQDADQKQRLKAGVNQQSAEADSLLSFYRQMLAIRAQFPWFAQASVEAVDLGHGELAAWRLRHEDQEALVIHNLSDKPISLPPPPGDTLITWDTGSGVASINAQALLLPPLGGCIRLP